MPFYTILPPRLPSHAPYQLENPSATLVVPRLVTIKFLNRSVAWLGSVYVLNKLNIPIPNYYNRTLYTRHIHNNNLEYVYSSSRLKKGMEDEVRCRCVDVESGRTEYDPGFWALAALVGFAEVNYKAVLPVALWSFLTDALDGYFARRWPYDEKESAKLFYCRDAHAFDNAGDSILFLGVLLSLCTHNPEWFWVLAIVVVGTVVF